ncbi:MAG: disulfide bond formation protein B [Pseudomonadota bacterium]
MNSPKPLLLIVGLSALALLGGGLYLQIVEKMLPCPLCVLQRYAFALIAIFCLVGVAMRRSASGFFSVCALVSAIAGAAVAGWHLWTKANPTVACGIDPLETSLNTIFPAQLFPLMFKADGLCTMEYAPIWGLSIPQWSMLWFVLFIVTLTVAFLKRHQSRAYRDA